MKKHVLGGLMAVATLGIALGIPQALPAGIGPFSQHPSQDDSVSALQPLDAKGRGGKAPTGDCWGDDKC